MNLVYTKSHHRLGVTLNYLSLTLLVALTYYMEAFGWNAIASGCIALAALVLVITLIQFHIRTGLWRLVHTGRENLNEKQTPMIYRSLHRSYGLFAIISLVVLLWKSVFPGPNPNLIVVFAALLYLAHTLPSAVIGWNEKDTLAMAGVE